MIPLQELLRIACPIAADLIEFTAERRAMTGVIGQHGSQFAGRVSDSGEGRWTSIAAIDEGVPTPVLTSALYSRFASRNDDDFANKILSAMRKQFGGHDEKHS